VSQSRCEGTHPIETASWLGDAAKGEQRSNGGSAPCPRAAYELQPLSLSRVPAAAQNMPSIQNAIVHSSANFEGERWSRRAASTLGGTRRQAVPTRQPRAECHQ
jgi:hypothetical protein